jgi:hypothetical protein
MRKQAAVSTRALIVGAALLGLGLAAACGNTDSSTGSGETHFLGSCDTGCGDRLQCRGGVCTLPCDDDSVCSALVTDATCVEQSCDVACEDDASCRRVSGALSCVAGHCREPVAMTGAGGGGGGGTTGARGGEAGTPGQVLACAGGCGESLCSVRSDSCSLETVCAAVGCGGFDVDANGCYRPTCENDDECPVDERCTARRTQGGCDWEVETCTCDFPPRVTRVCSATVVTGPRGAWGSVKVTEEQFEVVTTRTFFPDGTVHKEINLPESMETLQLPTAHLAQLVRLVDGPDLRPLLASPADCQAEPDYELSVRLELDTVTLEKGVAGCGDAHPEIGELQELIRSY